jgi:hypothetical protein
MAEYDGPDLRAWLRMVRSLSVTLKRTRSGCGGLPLHGLYHPLDFYRCGRDHHVPFLGRRHVHLFLGFSPHLPPPPALSW